MKKEFGQFVFSATDLANQHSCSHLTELDRRVANGVLEREYRRDPLLELLVELGERHERAYLDFLRGAGKRVVELEEFAGQAIVENTIAAMQHGVDVIAQASLVAQPWQGRADLLMKVDRPSRWGNWSYAVADTKLSHTTRAGAVLQLCLYTEILAEMQGLLPESMFIVKPGEPFVIETLRVSDFMAYYRLTKARFESFVAAGPQEASYPEPNPHCKICDWRPSCHQVWRDDDHLSFVAGITKSQILELESQGVSTLEAFADAFSPLATRPSSGSAASIAKVQKQAKIQIKGRRTGNHEIEFHEIESQRGLLRLPSPNDGDIFFDIEGNPRAGSGGLEYLFGFAASEHGSLNYHKLWALSPSAEKQLFEQFMDEVMRRWDKNPEMHIYHYAPYEPAALKRLAMRHTTRQEELDRLLRSERFVDLYAIVRQSILASVESYSIKHLERFYRYERLENLDDAQRSLLEVERLIELDMTSSLSPEHRNVVETYNKDDCFSTVALRDWLETLRSDLEASGQNLPRPEPKSGDAKEESQQQAVETQRVFDALIDDIARMPQDADQQARWLLAHLLDYFRREDKSKWWKYFELCELEEDLLTLERQAISGLRYVGEFQQGTKQKNPIHRYGFDPQEASMSIGNNLYATKGKKVGSVAAFDPSNGTLDIKKHPDSLDEHPSAVFVFEYINPKPMPESLLELGKRLVQQREQGHISSCRHDLLTRAAPRLKTLSLPMEGEQKDVAIQLAFDLDNSVLPIQGPPGAGKTYIGSHMIAALAKGGKRIGVTAVGHKVILNLLTSVHSADSSLSVAHQCSGDLPDFVQKLKDKDHSLRALNAGAIVGGTAWLWSNAALEQQLDYLFIDEAGQMSLAMALAAGRAAKNIILLGDPLQLEQPQQGIHPEGADKAVLCHILDGADTMPEDKGLFLKNTWRLHPSICEYTSEQFYDGRLVSCEGLHNQTVYGSSTFVGYGLRFVNVDHRGNQNRSDEEVATIRQIVDKLVDGHHEWSTKENIRLPITLDDVLIVAPYNAQVNALIAALPPAARVGTVDKFQGQEAPIVIYSMTSSSVADAPRGASFLLSPNRLNVATSRARCLVLLVGSPTLFEATCATPEEMRMVNGLCRFRELAAKHG